VQIYGELTYEDTEVEGSKLLNNDGVGGSVSGEDLVGKNLFQVVSAHASGLEFGAGLLGRLALHQGLRLRQEVGKEDLVVEASPNGVLSVGRRDEVGGDDPGALVQQLVERVLSVGSRLAPNDRPGAV